MSQSAIPVILVGRLGQMGRIVAENLQPDVEVLHFVADPDVGRRDVPLLLAGKQPSQPSSDGIGSQDYSKQPQAIMLGLGYTNDIVDDLRLACSDVRPGVPWLAGGYSKARFDELLATNPPAPPEKQGPITAARMKSKLKEYLDEGKGGKDGLYLWYDHS